VDDGGIEFSGPAFEESDFLEDLSMGLRKDLVSQMDWQLLEQFFRVMELLLNLIVFNVPFNSVEQLVGDLGCLLEPF